MRHRAFTLIELVISSGLMAVILVSGYLCLNSALASQKLIQARADMTQSARVALAIMSADLRSACALSKEFEFLGMDRMLGGVEADNLDFGTRNYTPRRAGEADFCEVSYFVVTEPESGSFSVWRRRDATPDGEPLSGGTREEIARGISGLRFEYYDGWKWYDDWGDAEGRGRAQNSLIEQANLTGMPEAVRITVWFEAAKTRKTDQESAESLMFQTVARLNLAGVFRGGASETSDASASPSTPQQPAQSGGGQQ
ncbi:MAG: hypothetical protein L0Y58_02760 [Verrucomicrobia subdivision 3 bacterium]|nr:hypothetical protein [Limisphaerales bacterium]